MKQNREEKVRNRREMRRRAREINVTPRESVNVTLTEALKSFRRKHQVPTFESYLIKSTASVDSR